MPLQTPRTLGELQAADPDPLLHMYTHCLPLSLLEPHLPPFRNTVSAAGMVGIRGGGSSARQGGTELVHRGGMAGHEAATKSFIHSGQNGLSVCTKGSL